jgi:hypothetical protein
VIERAEGENNITCTKTPKEIRRTQFRGCTQTSNAARLRQLGSRHRETQLLSVIKGIERSAKYRSGKTFSGYMSGALYRDPHIRRLPTADNNSNRSSEVRRRPSVRIADYSAMCQLPDCRPCDTHPRNRRFQPMSESSLPKNSTHVRMHPESSEIPPLRTPAGPLGED